jgi:hypothetical protein
MNGNDVRIPQSRSDVRFTPESREVLLVTGQGFGQELEGDEPVTMCIVCLIHITHSALTEQRIKAIISNLPQGHENRPPTPKSLYQACASLTVDPI